MGSRRRRGPWRCSRRVLRWGRGRASRPSLDQLAVGKADRDAGVAAFKAGRAATGGAEGEGFEAGVGAGRDRGEGFAGEGVIGRDADVFGVQPFSLRVAT